MHTSTRDQGRLAKDVISSLNIWTRYAVRDGKLIVSCPAHADITPEQEQLIRTYREELIEYLTSPPGADGECIRGHGIEWKLSEFGDWLCSCYFQLSPPAKLDNRTDSQPATASVYRQI